MKILFVWTGVTSYMADCWRELAAHPGVELKIIIEPHVNGRELNREQVLAGLDAVVADSSGQAWDALSGYTPDILFAVGWHSHLVRDFVAHFADVPKVCCMDMPWRPKLRCILARIVLGRYVRRFQGAFVPGAAAARYAHWLGFKCVWKGLFGIRTDRFAQSGYEPPHHPNRRGFIYVGRNSPEKGLDFLRSAYTRYREQGGTWPLDFIGGAGRFVQPDELGAVYRQSACLVLASSFDPWPLVVLEAKAAGLLAIVSDRCGNADELGAVKVPFGDIESLADALAAAEKSELEWREGAPASVYDVTAWTDRVLAICRTEIRQSCGD